MAHVLTCSCVHVCFLIYLDTYMRGITTEYILACQPFSCPRKKWRGRPKSIRRSACVTNAPLRFARPSLRYARMTGEPKHIWHWALYWAKNQRFFPCSSRKKRMSWSKNGEIKVWVSVISKYRLMKFNCHLDVYCHQCIEKRIGPLMT